MARDLSTRIEKLNEEQTEVFEQRVDKEEDRLREELEERYEDGIENTIFTDLEEIDDFNVIISAFEQSEIDYQFIRTEPLYHESEKNLDILVAALDKGIAVFFECERSLVTKTDQKISNFWERADVFKNGSAKSVDTDEYLTQTLGQIPETSEYVLSSRNTPDGRIVEKGQKMGLNFNLWSLSSHGVRCYVSYHVVKESKTAPYTGHNDNDLVDYLRDTLCQGVEFQTYVNFTYSSSQYLKLRHMAFTLVNRHHEQDNEMFNYDDWRFLFRRELSNYHNGETETMYSNFIEYGRKCDIVELEEDNDDLLMNKYRIVYSASRRRAKLLNELTGKMAKHEMEDDLEEQLTEKKKEILRELEQDHATGGLTLSDFSDEHSQE